MTKLMQKTKIKSANGFAEAERRISHCLITKKDSLMLLELGLDQFPESIKKLTWIRKLNIGKNKITCIPDWIGDLVELRDLRMHCNPLQAIPNNIGKLTKLKGLSLSECTETCNYDVIGALVNLEELVLGRLGLTQVPCWIRKFTKLRNLQLYGNELTTLPEWISELRMLNTLALSNNKLHSLPVFLRNLPRLQTLYAEGNNNLELPVETMQRGNAQKILDYYLRVASPGTSQPLNEFKLILVGRGLVGKTSLVHRLVKDKFKKFDRTPGINITKWPREIDGDEVHAHIWDFGGQEIMHGTHRFFMTERALYLVLISGREGTEDYDAEYWLSMVRSFAGDVPVIVLLNKSDDYRFELNRELLREKYGKDIVFIETDSSTGTGIPELCDQICAHAKKLPGLKASWPVEWRQIKDELPAQKRSWLTFDNFRTFCHNHGITIAKDQEDLAESLHDLGLMLSYRKEEALRSFGVLNPEWVTDGIYKVLNSPTFRDAGGKFTVASFAQVLPAKTYPQKLHPYLLALMRKFQLCHPLDDKGNQYLIPDLLTKEEPKLDSEFPPEKCLGFVYRYDAVLPEGLLPRFIVETYVHQEPKFAWRTGVVLERANCRALVRGDVQGRKITIRVAGVGNGRRELLGIIREYFERIHKSYEKLPVTWLVPVPGHPTVTVPYGELLDYEAAGDDEYKVVIDRKPVKLSVKNLLDGIDLPGVPRREDTELMQKLGLSDALSLFISYSHKDDTYMDQLRAALVPYERTGELEVWADPLIEPGQKWEGEIFTNLDRAQVVILLISNDFMGSYFCMEKELARAVERHGKGECEIVPIIVRASRFDKLPLGKIQAIIPGNKPIDEHEKKDPAWLEVTKQLDRVIARLKSK